MVHFILNDLRVSLGQSPRQALPRLSAIMTCSVINVKIYADINFQVIRVKQLSQRESTSLVSLYIYIMPANGLARLKQLIAPTFPPKA